MSLLQTFNPYSHEAVTVILTKRFTWSLFPGEERGIEMEDYKAGDKAIPFRVLKEFTGKDFEGVRYEQLLPHLNRQTVMHSVVFRWFCNYRRRNRYRSHRARVLARWLSSRNKNGIGSLTLVDKRDASLRDGRICRWVCKEQYLSDAEKEIEKKNKAERNISAWMNVFPSNWKRRQSFQGGRNTNIPIRIAGERINLYCIIRWIPGSSELQRKDRLVGTEQNNQLETGEYRNRTFRQLAGKIWSTGIWVVHVTGNSAADLENRRWQWRNMCWICTGIANDEIEKAIKAGLMKSNPYKEIQQSTFNIHQSTFDLHRPYVDDVILVSASGKPMKRELDLIDVWFDSGAMPYAQWHFMGDFESLPFKGTRDEGRGTDVKSRMGMRDEARLFRLISSRKVWIRPEDGSFTLHAIAVLAFDSIVSKM